MMTLRNTTRFLIGVAVLMTAGMWIPWLNDQWTQFSSEHVTPAIPRLIEKLLGG